LIDNQTIEIMLGMNSEEKKTVRNIHTRADFSSTETVVGPTVRIEGDLVSDGDIKVEGFVHGTVKTSRNLFVGPQARIEANIEAGYATIAGAVIGDVKTAGVLSILDTGRVEGDVQCEKIAIEEGAYFNGVCKMAEPQQNRAFTSTTLTEED
jgi:cytoskeletal protein CcmA (bactofilin family)